MRRGITDLYVSLCANPDGFKPDNGSLLLQILHYFFNHLEENTTIEKAEPAAPEWDKLDYLIAIKEKEVEINLLKIEMQDIKNQLKTKTGKRK